MRRVHNMLCFVYMIFLCSVRPAAPSRRISSAPSPAAVNILAASASTLEARPSAAASRMERARAASHSLAALGGKEAAQ